MTPQEAIAIAKYVASLCPQQKFNEFTPDTWGDVLAPYDLDETRAAVIAVASRQPFVAPAEILAEIRARRADRIAAANLIYSGDPNETGAQSAQSVRALIRSAAAGHVPPASIGRIRAIESAKPPTGRARALLGAVGERIPSVRAGITNVLAVACPRCLARPGRNCMTGTHRRADAHPARLEDARRAAAGLPPVDQADVAAEMQRRIAAAQAALAGLDPADIEPRDGFQHPNPQSEAS